MGPILDGFQQRPARLFMTVVLVYLIAGSLYAVYTPDWQAPDEPAHYNYIRYLAETHHFPVLKLGDYPAAYLEEIKAAHFPPEMSIAPIRYEFHQPPLYYLLATPVYWLFGGALLPLRFLSLAVGALLLVVVWWTVGALVPGRPFLAVGTAAFTAFLPMHLAMTAAVNNDPLAELLIAIEFLLVIRYVRVDSRPEGKEEFRLLFLLGLVTGLGFLTKSSAYVTLPLVLAVIAARHLWLDAPPPPALHSLKAVGIFLLPAVALGVPWWLRNLVLYGGADFLGLGRHEVVVAGQLRTAEFVAEHGRLQLVHDFLQTSFRSFWGQFGWMGVLLDQRLYQALVIVSALACAGWIVWAIRRWRHRFSVPPWQWAAGGLLALSALFTGASYLWYNITFVQHQGRYLFPALVPIGLAMAVGWREALRRERALLMALLVIVSAVALRAGGMLPNWPLLMLAATAIAFGFRRVLPPWFDPAVQAVPYLLLIGLDLVSLFLFIVPQLRV